MNTDELQAGPELDMLIVEKVMRWTPLDKGWWATENDDRMTMSIFKPSTDNDAVWHVEEKIDELGLRHKYIIALVDTLLTDTKESAMFTMNWLKITGGFAWFMVHATPEQRCRAALKAVQENDK